MAVGRHDWIGDVLRDVRKFCEQNSLNQTAAEVAHALSVLERENSQANPPLTKRRTLAENSNAKLV